MILLNFFNNKEMRMKCHRLNEVLELPALKKITKKTLKPRY